MVLGGIWMPGTLADDGGEVTDPMDVVAGKGSLAESGEVEPAVRPIFKAAVEEVEAVDVDVRASRESRAQVDSAGTSGRGGCNVGQPLIALHSTHRPSSQSRASIRTDGKMNARGEIGCLEPMKLVLLSII